MRLLRSPFVVFTLFFAVSRVGLYAAGLRFFPDHSHSMMHFVDLPLLRDAFTETLWHLHGQPPLMSLLLAGVLAVGEVELTHVVFLAAGLVLGWSWIAVLRRMGMRAGWAVTIAVAFSLLPSCVVYENYLFYTYLVVAVLGLQAACIARAVQAPGFWNWTMVFGLAAVLALFKNVFHLVWMLGLIAIVWRLSARADRRGVLVASILPLLLVASWYGKNLVVFGRFEASSWMGFGLARKTYHQLDQEERIALARRVDPIIAVHLYGSVDEFAKVVPMPPATGVALLDHRRKVEGTNNFHHAIYLDVCDRMVDVGWRLIREDPAAYLRNVVETIQQMFAPASRWWPARETLAQAQPYCYLVDLALHGSWRIRGINYWSIMTALTLLAGGAMAIRALLRTTPSRPRTMLVTTATFTASYVLALGALLDTNETNRHRFLVDGIIVLAAILLVRRRGGRDEPEPGGCREPAASPERIG